MKARLRYRPLRDMLRAGRYAPADPLELGSSLHCRRADRKHLTAQPVNRHFPPSSVPLSQQAVRTRSFPSALSGTPTEPQASRKLHNQNRPLKDAAGFPGEATSTNTRPPEHCLSEKQVAALPTTPIFRSRSKVEFPWRGRRANAGRGAESRQNQIAK